MKVLLFNLATDADDPILGFTTRWIQALARRMEFIHVITMRAGRVEVPENVRVYSVGKEKGYSEPRRAAEFYRHLFSILREDRIDACFSHMIPIFTVLAAPVLKAKGIPIVTWYLHPSLTFTLKLAHYLSDRIVTALETSYPYRKDKVIVVGHGIDTDIFCPDGSPPEEPPMILCVGRLSPVKDHPTLIRAAALLRERWGKPFRVVILGGPAGPQDEPYVRSLHRLVEELSLRDIVSFHPPVPQSALPDWYRRCTVHVNLTPTGFGDKVAWEAMACGRPCLAANEGFRETMGKYAGALLFRYGDAESLADRLLWLFGLPPEEGQCIGGYLRKRVVALHSVEATATRIVEALKGRTTQTTSGGGILHGLDRLVVRRAARAVLPASWRASLRGVWGWVLAPRSVDLGGASLYRLPGIEGGRWLTLARGEYEPETTRLLRHLLKPGAHFVDVGAHIGYYTLLAAAIVGPRGRVWAFEPAPDTYGILLEEVRRNGFANVQTERLAVGSAGGDVPFFLHPARGKSSLYLGAGTGKPIIVPLTSLDAYFRERCYPRVDVVKMDIEGGEVQALVGMRETVARNPHLCLVVEFNPRALHAAGCSPVDFLDALHRANFRRVHTIEALPRALSTPQQVLALAEELLQSREKKVVNLLCGGPEAGAL